MAKTYKYKMAFSIIPYVSLELKNTLGHSFVYMLSSAWHWTFTCCSGTMAIRRP